MAGRGTGRAVLGMALMLASAGGAGAASPVATNAADQPILSSKHKRVLTVGGLRFKDLNADGRLNPYEDWRLGAEARAADLVGRMTIDEKLGLMVIGTQLMGRSPTRGAAAAGGVACAGPRSADGILCEATTVDRFNRWAMPGTPGYDLQAPQTRSHPTTVGIQQHGIRRFIIRENPDPTELTIWTNRIQEAAEASRLGVPVVMTSNPRNHASANLAFGFSEASGLFSTWPGTLGLAASRDLRLVADFARIARSEWDATGIRAGYMYQADLATDPRWFRIPDTFGDDPTVVADITETIVRGFQAGPQLSPGGVLMTTKHFPGGGPRDRGSDPHYVYGRASPYPTLGSLFQHHLPPFNAAIAANTAAIMPYYALPVNDRSAPQLAGGAAFEEVGFAFNRAILQDLLRTQLGFKGYVNSDSGIIVSMAWGDKVEAMDYPQRAALAINAGVDVISDTQDVAFLREAYDRGLITETRIDLSAGRLLVPIFQQGLFEDPYRNVAAAQKLVDDPSHWARAYEAHQKSVVLMKNEQGLLPLSDAKLAGKKVYVQVLGHDDRSDAVIQMLQKRDPAVQFTRNLAEAALAFVLIDPNDRADRRTESYFDLEVHKATGVDVDRLNQIQAAIPTIVSVNLEMPWLLGPVEPGARAMVAGFSTRADATWDVLRGRVRPNAKLPITLPRTLAAVVAAETNGPARANRVTSSDVPGFARPAADRYVYRDSVGAEYRTGFGLTY